MTEGLNYPMNIEDGMSGPARDAASALKALESQIRAAEKALHAMQGEQLNYKRAGFKGAAGDVGLDIAKVRHELGGLKGAYKDIADAVPKHESSSIYEEVGEHMFGAVTAASLLASGIERVGEAALEAGKYLGELAIEATKFAVEAAEFRENTTLAYTAVKGSAEEGERTFAIIDKIALKAHMPAEKAHDLARDLMLQGLTDTRLIGETIEAQAALMRTGQIAGAEKLKKIIERSTASGHFDPGKLGGGHGGATSGRALAGMGVSLPGLIDQIAKDTHKSVSQVGAELKAGKITVDEGVAALSESITRGVIGQAARAKYDIHDFATDSTNSFRRMVQGIDLKPLQQGLLDIGTALGFVADHKDGVQSVFQTVVDWAGKAIEKGLEFGEDMVIAFLRTEIALAPVIQGFQSIYHVLEKIQGMGGGTIGMVLGMSSPLQNLQRIMDTQTAAGARETGVKMGDDVIKGAREATHTHSPSTDMADFGHDLRAGLDMGFDARSIGSDVRGGIMPSMPSQSSAVGGGAAVHVSVGDIIVHGAADAHVTAMLLESQLTDIFYRVGLELGQ